MMYLLNENANIRIFKLIAKTVDLQQDKLNI